MGTFLKTDNKTTKMMIRILIALIPIIIFSIYRNGYLHYKSMNTSLFTIIYPLIFILIGGFVCFFIELILNFIFKKKKYNSFLYSFIYGLILALILPIKTPIYILIVGAVITATVKFLFERFEKNIFNPALIGYIFIAVVFSNVLSSNFDFNGYQIDNMLKFEAILCLISYIYLAITKTIKWKIPLTYISSVLVITYVIGNLLGKDLIYPVFQMLNGLLLFGSIFIATDPATSTVTPIGQILQGMFLAIFTVLFRFLGFDGTIISILIVNTFIFLLDKVGCISRFNFVKSLPYFILTWLIVIILIFGIAISKKNTNNKEFANCQFTYHLNSETESED